MRKPNFNKYLRYDELTRLLKQYAKEYPNLLKLDSIGKSYEGRTVWLVTATNFKSGPDADKPALWVDGKYPRFRSCRISGSTLSHLYACHEIWQG